MAGDWIKMRVDLYRDPKVCAMADLITASDGELARYVSQHMQRDMTVTRNVMRNVIVGALLSVWGVMRARGKSSGSDLVCRGVTSTVIDDIADLPGFGSAMLAVGWATEVDGNLVFPRFFEEHNTDPAETAKMKNAQRQRRFREKNQADKDNVTRNVTVTHREEKRREEEKIPPNPRKRGQSFDASAAELPPWLPADVWQTWVEYRAESGKRLTPKSCEQQLADLGAWREKGHDPAAIIRASIRNQWQGLFEPKDGARRPAGPSMPTLGADL